MLERAQTAGVASGVLMGDSALIVAVVPVGTARRGDSTYLCWRCRSPRRTSRRRRACPSLLSDGTRPISVAGSASQQSALARLVGTGGPRAARAIRSRPGWRWRRGGPRSSGSGCCTRRAAAASSDSVPVLLAVVALVLARARLFVLRRKTAGRRGGEGTAAPAVGNPAARRAGDAPKTARELKRRGTQPYEQPTRWAIAHPGRQERAVAGQQRDARLERRHRGSRRGGWPPTPLPARGRDHFEHVRPLSPAAAAGRGRHGGALHGGAAWRGGVPPGVRREAPAARGRAQPRRRRAVHRRGEARVVAGALRTSSRCSTSARSATSTSWRRSTSSGATREG